MRPTRACRIALANRAERAHRATRSSTSEPSQWPASTWNALPRRRRTLHRSCTPWMPWLAMIASGLWSGPNASSGVVSSTRMGRRVPASTLTDSSDGE